jgi:tetratricopeptide (TPR) repeat protein
MLFESSPNKREEIYNEYLQEIEGIIFTLREIDIIACILHNRGEKKIASILSISHRTVSSHVHNIMRKLGHGSREYIIDTVEKTGKLHHIRQYYFHLVIRFTFETKLKKIAALLNNSGVSCRFDTLNSIGEEKKLFDQLTRFLNLARIKLIPNNDLSKEIKCNIYALNESATIDLNQNSKENIHKNIALLLDRKTDISLFNNLYYIDFRNDSEYYLSTFKLIEEIINKTEVMKIISEFKDEYQKIQSSYQETGTTSGDLRQNNYRNIFYKNKLLIASITVVFLTFLLVNVKNDLLPTVKKEEDNNKIEAWNLPRNLGYYTQRRDITKAIWNKFENQKEGRKTAILVGLHGLGGIGKTTLAKNAIYNPEQYYSFRGWFSAETKALLQADYVELGEKHHLFTKNMLDHQKLIRVREWLEQQENTLLVYDNVVDIDMLEEYLPNKGHIIITSRNYKLLGAIEIDVMTEDEALELLNNLIPEKIKQEQNYKNNLIILARELGYLPLALSQAGAYIAENMLTVLEYLSLYGTEKNRLLSNKTMPVMDQHEPAYITWDMSLKKIISHQYSIKALALLDLIAYCYPENIPKRLLAQYLYNQTDNETLIKLNEVLSLLKQYSFIGVSTDTVSVHRLVHLWLQSKHSKEQKHAILKNIIKIIKSFYPWKNKTTTDVAFVKLLLPHAGELLLQAQSLTEETEYTILLSVLGNGYHTLGDYTRSRQFFEKILNINKRQFGENSIEVAKISYDLGKTNIYLGNYIEAKQLLEKSLLIREKHFGIQHIETAETLHHLGRVYLNLGDYTRSRQLLEKALLIKEKYYGTEHIETIHTLHQLGSTHLSLGNYIKAKELLEKSLGVNKKHYGANHTETARTLYNLGRVYLNLGNYIEAKQLLEKSLLIRENHFGFQHVETADVLHQLGRTYLNLGDYIQAKELLEKALLIKEKYYGAEHIGITSSLYNLGRIHLQMGNGTKAKQLLEKAWHIAEKYNNSQHLSIANILGILGTYYLASAEYDKSKDLFEKAYNIIITLHNDDSIFAAKSLINLGNIYRILSNYQESKQFLEQALMIIKKHYSYDTITAAKVTGNLGLLYGNLGDNTKKKEYLEKALVIFKAHLYSGHVDIKLTINELNKVNNFSKIISKGRNLDAIGYSVILLP